MTNITNLTTSQLRQVLALKEQIEALQNQIDSIAGGEVPSPSTEDAPTPGKRKYHMSAAHKRKLIKALAKARKIRWAKAKGMANKGKRRISAAGRAAMSAAGKARWAKARAEGRKTL